MVHWEGAISRVPCWTLLAHEGAQRSECLAVGILLLSATACSELSELAASVPNSLAPPVKFSCCWSGLLLSWIWHLIRLMIEYSKMMCTPERPGDRTSRFCSISFMMACFVVDTRQPTQIVVTITSSFKCVSNRRMQQFCGGLQSPIELLTERNTSAFRNVAPSSYLPGGSLRALRMNVWSISEPFQHMCRNNSIRLCVISEQMQSWPRPNMHVAVETGCDSMELHIYTTPGMYSYVETVGCSLRA